MIKRIVTFLLPVGLAFCSAAWAIENTAPTPAKPLANPAPMAGNLLQVTLGLILVVIAIFAVAWVVRRYGSFHTTAKGALKVIGGLSMGARERVVLLQVGDKQLLLGVAPGRIQTLHVLDEPLPVDEAGPRVPGNHPFAQRLAAVLKGGRPQ
jgi:flagellar protein FliO/FliZ